MESGKNNVIPKELNQKEILHTIVERDQGIFMDEKGREQLEMTYGGEIKIYSVCLSGQALPPERGVREHVRKKKDN